MSAIKNWPISTGRDGVVVTASPAGTATRVVPTSDLGQLVAEDAMIDNPGPLDVFAQAGGPSVVATALSFRIPANSLQPVRKDQTSHIALYCANGTQNCIVHIGEGA